MASSKEIFKLAQEIFADLSNNKEKLVAMRALLNNYVNERTATLSAEQIASQITKEFTKALIHSLRAGAGENTIGAEFAKFGYNAEDLNPQTENPIFTQAHLNVLMGEVAERIRDENQPLLSIQEYVADLAALVEKKPQQEQTAPTLATEDVPAQAEATAKVEEEEKAETPAVPSVKLSVQPPVSEVVSELAPETSGPTKKEIAMANLAKLRAAALAKKEESAASNPVVVVAPAAAKPVVVVAPAPVAKTADDLLAALSQSTSDAAYDMQSDTKLEELISAITDVANSKLVSEQQAKETALQALKDVIADEQSSNTTSLRSYVRDNFAAFNGSRVEPFTKILANSFIERFIGEQKMTNLIAEANIAVSTYSMIEEAAKDAVNNILDESKANLFAKVVNEQVKTLPIDVLKEIFKAALQQAIASNKAESSFRSFMRDNFAAYEGARVDQFVEILSNSVFDRIALGEDLKAMQAEGHIATTILTQVENAAKQKAALEEAAPTTPQVKTADVKLAPVVPAAKKATDESPTKGANAELAAKLDRRRAMVESAEKAPAVAATTPTKPVVPPRPALTPLQKLQALRAKEAAKVTVSETVAQQQDATSSPKAKNNNV